MALVRILVDGYSLLHNWPRLAPGKPRHSAVAREELIHTLTQYFDASGTPITVVFDGSRSGREPDETPSTPDVEILYSRAGQSADQIIEKAAFRLKPHGDVLVVTDDLAERDMVSGFGGLTSSCQNFVQTVESAIAELQRELSRYNQKEQLKFRTH
jgi:predicted RNA-binding protein with PIN domain